MNIVPSTASLPSPVQPRTDGPATGSGAPDPAAATDGAAASTTPATDGFGSMLSRHLDDGRADAATRASASRGRGDEDAKLAGSDAGAVEPGDPATGFVAADKAAADAASSAGVPDLFPTPAATAKPATSGASVGTTGGTTRRSGPDDDRTRDGDAGSELAAQLALASQWSGAARPVDAAPSPSTPTAATAPAIAAGAFDVKASPGRDRAASIKDDALAGRTAGSSNHTQTATGAAFTAASGDASNGDARQNDRGDTPAGNPSIVAAKDDAKTRDTLAAAALDAASAAVVVAPTHAQTIADGDAFALRLATQVANVQTAMATTTAATATVAATPDVLREPVGSPAWLHEVGQATLRMAANDLQSASLRLNPEHLGPLDVQVRVDNGVAHLAFNATHVDTRQALEASRGTLDQLFTHQGLKMGDVSVGSGSGNGSNDASAARDQAADARRDGGRWSGNDAGNDGDAPVRTVTTRIAQALGLVDTFA